MKLFFDPRDDQLLERRGMRTLYWLDDLGAAPVTEARAEDEGYLFAGARSIEDYHELVAGLPRVRDRPEDRAPLLRLDSVLDALAVAGVELPAPRTWRLPLDAPLPSDLQFPLFLRTAVSSWKLGGAISKVDNVVELKEEAATLRRAFGWDALVLAREWLELAKAGERTFGAVPQEIRVWIVDGAPIAWAFHHLAIVPRPQGFPPTDEEIQLLAEFAKRVGKAFRARCVVADFAKHISGDWVFLEAGPGSCAGIAHEGVFKFVAARLRGETLNLAADGVGGSIVR